LRVELLAERPSLRNLFIPKRDGTVLAGNRLPAHLGPIIFEALAVTDAAILHDSSLWLSQRRGLTYNVNVESRRMRKNSFSALVN
jgi:hypothetical protein